MNHRRVILLLRILVVVVVVGFFIVGRMESSVTVAHDGIKIGGLYGKQIQLEEINEVRLEEGVPKIIKRTNGFSAGDYQKGNYKLEGIERARLYLHAKQGPYILLNTANDLIYINYKEPQKTKKLYEELTSVINVSK